MKFEIQRGRKYAFGVSLKYHLVSRNIPLWVDYIPTILLYDDGIYTLTAYRKVFHMGAINPEGERIRAQAVLRSLTEYQEAVNLFTPRSSQVETAEPAATINRPKGQFILRVFKAITLNRRPVQRPTYSPRQVTPCSE
jgi:hypothetical protein